MKPTAPIGPSNPRPAKPQHTKFKMDKLGEGLCSLQCDLDTLGERLNRLGLLQEDVAAAVHSMRSIEEVNAKLVEFRGAVAACTDMEYKECLKFVVEALEWVMLLRKKLSTEAP